MKAAAVFRATGRSSLLLSLMGLALAGCGGPQGFLVPAPSDAGAPGTTAIEMVAATTRQRVESPAFLFGGGRAEEVSFADMIVSIPPDAHRQIGEVQYPQKLPGNPETDFVTLKAEVVSREQAASAFSRLLRSAHKKEALVFVHGFNTRFEDAVYSFAQILHDSRAYEDVAPVLFTWPSKGQVFAYGYDRDSSTFSRDALEKLLRHLQDDPGVETISVLAHSMGNWVTLEALRQMAIRDGRLVPKIKLVMLADPDVDVGIARQQIDAMGPERPHVVLFVSGNDRALAASRDFWEEPRLGAIDPYVEPYKTLLEQEKISVIDMTRMPSHDFFNHGKFSSDPRVVELIGRSLASGQALSASRVGLGARILMTTEGAANTVGHAAGLAISAPISIVDPETRQNFGDQLDAFGHSVRQIGSGFSN